MIIIQHILDHIIVRRSAGESVKLGKINSNIYIYIDIYFFY